MTLVSNKFYLLLDLNQWLPPYESNTLTTELSRSFIITKRNKWDLWHRWIINEIFLRSNTNQRDQKNMLLYHVIFILTINYLHDKICITSTRAIAQLVEHLVYTRANVFQRSPSYNQKSWFYWEIDVLLYVFGKKTREQQPDKRFGPIRAPIFI